MLKEKEKQIWGKMDKEKKNEIEKNTMKQFKP